MPRSVSNNRSISPKYNKESKNKQLFARNDTVVTAFADNQPISMTPRKKKERIPFSILMT